jgi:hypothetical protein
LTIGAWVLSLAATTASLLADGVAQADAWFISTTLLIAGGIILAQRFFASAVGGAARVGGFAAGTVGLGARGAVGGAAGAGAGVVFLFIFFAFLFAFLGAFGVFTGTTLLELADFQRNGVSLDAQTDGQFRSASLGFGWRVQDLAWVVWSQLAADFVAFRFPGQTLLLTAFEFAFQVISTASAFQTRDETVTIAGVFLNADALLEGEFALRLALRGRRR